MCKVQTFDVQKSTNILCAKLQNAMIKGTYRYKHSIFKSTGTGTNNNQTCYVQKYKHSMCKSTTITGKGVKVFSILCAQKVKSVNI